MIRRPPALAGRGLVVASHPLASEAGIEMLRAGGHAVDAAVAAAAVLAVVEPAASGLGGDAFLLIHDRADGSLSAINGSGGAPRGLTADMFGRQREIPARSPLSVTVPGCVAAWDEASYGWGRLDWEDLFEPAMRLAEEGFPVSWRMARILRREHEGLSADPGLASLFLDAGGAPLRAGAICRPQALARTLATLASEGADAFYRGSIAGGFARGVREAGGVLGVEDLASHESDLRAPLEMGVDRSGIAGTLCQQPLPSPGLLVLLALGILQELGPTRGAEELHRQIESVRIAFALRDLLLADPRTLPVPEEDLMAMLLAPETLGALARLVRDDAIVGPGKNAADVTELCPIVIETLRSAGAQQASILEGYRRAGFGFAARSVGNGADTTYLCAADADGNAVGLIQSIYHPFGAGFVEPGTGIIPNNRACGFSLDPASPNRLAPGKRPRHTLNSWALLSGDDLQMLGGTPGAQNQIAVNIQLLRAILAGEPLWPGPAPMVPGKWSQARIPRTRGTAAGPAGETVEIAELLPAVLEAPRWDFDPLGRVRLEARFPAGVRSRLGRRGHSPVRGGPWDGSGLAQAIARLETGAWLGATDPRGEGAAIGL